MTGSMTGYGRAQETIGGKEIGVEIKSVNHRFFEFSPRVPRAYAYLEDKLKALVNAGVSRGKVDLSVSIVALEGSTAKVEINRALAAEYLAALRGLGGELGIADDITLSAISRFSDIFAVRRQEEDEDEIWQAVRQVAQRALEKFLAMRAAEGEKLADDIRGRLLAIEGHVTEIERQAPKTAEDYRTRLEAKIAEILADRQIDEARILTEAAIFAERVAADEETVRLRSHIAQFRQILSAEKQVGRKLDFLVQELNREANTIGSKAQDINISRAVVEIKSEIEKIREQIQNLE